MEISCHYNLESQLKPLLNCAVCSVQCDVINMQHAVCSMKCAYTGGCAAVVSSVQSEVCVNFGFLLKLAAQA